MSSIEVVRKSFPRADSVAIYGPGGHIIGFEVWSISDASISQVGVCLGKGKTMTDAWGKAADVVNESIDKLSEGFVETLIRNSKRSHHRILASGVEELIRSGSVD